MEWKGEQIIKKLRTKNAKRIEACAIVAKNEAKRLLTQKDNLSGKNPSKPGEPAAKVTGRESSSISHQMDNEKLVARMGTNVPYAKYQELGTRHMAARPWLRPALANVMEQIKKIIGGK